MSERAIAPVSTKIEASALSTGSTESEGCSFSHPKLCVAPSYSPGKSPSDRVAPDPATSRNNGRKGRSYGRHQRVAPGDPERDFGEADALRLYLQRAADFQRSMRLGNSTLGAATMVVLGAVALRFAAAETLALLESELVATIATESAIFGTGFAGSAAAANFRLWAITAWKADGDLDEIEKAQQFFDLACAEMTPVGIAATQNLWQRAIFGWKPGMRPQDPNVIDAQWRWATDAPAIAGEATVPAMTSSAWPTIRRPSLPWRGPRGAAANRLLPFLPGGSGMLTQLLAHGSALLSPGSLRPTPIVAAPTPNITFDDVLNLPVPDYTVATLPEDLAWTEDPAVHKQELAKALRYVLAFGEQYLPSDYWKTYEGYAKARWTNPVGGMDRRDDVIPSGQQAIVNRLRDDVLNRLAAGDYGLPHEYHVLRLAELTSDLKTAGQFSVAKFAEAMDHYFASLPGGLGPDGTPAPVAATGALRDQRPPPYYRWDPFHIHEYFRVAPVWLTIRGLVSNPRYVDLVLYGRRAFTADHDGPHDQRESPYPQLPQSSDQVNQLITLLSSGSFYFEIPTLARQVHFNISLGEKYNIVDSALRNDLSSRIMMIYYANAHESGESRLPERMLARLLSAKGREDIAYNVDRSFRAEEILDVSPADIQASIDEFIRYVKEYLSQAPASRYAEAEFSVALENHVDPRRPEKPGSDLPKRSAVSSYLDKVIGAIKLHVGSRYPTRNQCLQFLKDDKKDDSFAARYRGATEAERTAYRELLAFVQNWKPTTIVGQRTK
jgi:hypothetical protein